MKFLSACAIGAALIMPSSTSSRKEQLVLSGSLRLVPHISRTSIISKVFVEPIHLINESKPNVPVVGIKTKSVNIPVKPITSKPTINEQNEETIRRSLKAIEHMPR